MWFAWNWNVSHNCRVCHSKCQGCNLCQIQYVHNRPTCSMIFTKIELELISKCQNIFSHMNPDVNTQANVEAPTAEEPGPFSRPILAHLATLKPHHSGRDGTRCRTVEWHFAIQIYWCEGCPLSPWPQPTQPGGVSIDLWDQHETIWNQHPMEPIRHNFSMIFSSTIGLSVRDHIPDCHPFLREQASRMINSQGHTNLQYVRFVAVVTYVDLSSFGMIWISCQTTIENKKLNRQISETSRRHLVALNASTNGRCEPVLSMSFSSSDSLELIANPFFDYFQTWAYNWPPGWTWFVYLPFMPTTTLIDTLHRWGTAWRCAFLAKRWGSEVAKCSIM